MSQPTPIRLFFQRVAPSALATIVSLASLAAFPASQALFAQPAHPAPLRTVPAPIERRSPAKPLRGDQLPKQQFAQQHLSQWMESHRNLPLAQQQSALAAEPGFRTLQPQVQQRMHERLSQLNTMPPDQRQRVIERTEAMERLTPPQRQQVREAMQQLGNLPEERRHLVARNFRALRSLPEAQRQAYLDSPQLRAQLSDEERGTLNGLLNVAPLLPPPAVAQPQTGAPAPTPQ